MKTTLIRAFVLTLAFSGIAATAHSKTVGHTVTANASAFPVPMCPINDPNGCGID